MRFYRGLNLDNAEIEFIRQQGDCNVAVGSWLLKPLIDHHNLSVDEIEKKILLEPHDIERYNRNSKDNLDLGKYVTGCILGASVYSHDSSEKQEHVIVELETNLDNVFIDGRDFLYNAFPKLIKQDNIAINLKNNLVDAFGIKIIQYVEMAKQLEKDQHFDVKESDKLWRLIDYICLDTDIIQSHWENKGILIQGRFSTRFFSSFAVIGGIKPEMIIDIRKSEPINRQTSVHFLQSEYDIKDSIDISEIN
jgi:hypothetical protein